MTTTLTQLGDKLMLIPLKVCPLAPPGAQKYADQFTGYALWLVLWGFGIAVVLAIGAILVGKGANMPHVSKGGFIGLFVIAGAALLYIIFPDVINSMLGSGCV